MGTYKSKISEGFTLIELSIVLIIIGLFLSGGLAGLKIFMHNKKLATTEAHLKKAEDALKSYLAMNKAYPCPASFTAPREDAQFGKSIESCVTPKDLPHHEHDPSRDKNTPTITAKGRDDRLVRVGLLPFRSLGISDAAAVDGWGRLLQYAITEKMTDKDSFDQKSGAIDVVDEKGHSRQKPPGSVQYVIFSTGEDGAGGFSSEGIRISPCPEGTRQAENCDGDATFMDTGKWMASEEEKKKRAAQGKPIYTIDYDDYLIYEQYDVGMDISSRAIIYMYPKECPAGFEKVDMAKDVTAVGIETLSLKMPENITQIMASMNDEGVLCMSKNYSVTITYLSDKRKDGRSNCPIQWTSIGYRIVAAEMDSSTYEVCAR